MSKLCFTRTVYTYEVRCYALRRQLTKFEATLHQRNVLCRYVRPPVADSVSRSNTATPSRVLSKAVYRWIHGSRLGHMEKNRLTACARKASTEWLTPACNSVCQSCTYLRMAKVDHPRPSKSWAIFYSTEATMERQTTEHIRRPWRQSSTTASHPQLSSLTRKVRASQAHRRQPRGLPSRGPNCTGFPHHLCLRWR